MKRFVLLLCALCGTLPMVPAREIRINTPKSTLLLYAKQGEKAELRYFGARLHPEDNPLQAGNAYREGAYPAFGPQCVHEYAIQATHTDGNQSLELVVEQIEEQCTDGIHTVAIQTRDKHYPFYVTLHYRTHEGEDVIEAWSEITHTEEAPVTLYRFASALLPIWREGDNHLTHFHGNWGSENDIDEMPIQGGMFVLRNKDGVRNTRTDNPSFMLSLDGPAREEEGRIIAGALAWSGNFRIAVLNDETPFTRIFAGINEEQSHYRLAPNERFITPRFAFCYSNEGKGGISRSFHRWARNHNLHNGKDLRPILLNSWEGVYFNITEEKMDRMMADFAALGGEMFVMDDGWFGEKYPRNNDTTALGDWVVDQKKLPHGIEWLIKRAKTHGLKFGIWIEPEMTTTNSELTEKHPEWVIQQPHREWLKGRGQAQLVLDLANPEVQDFVFGVVDNLMTAHPDIDYIKWDANMTLVNYGSTYLPTQEQSHLYIAYHRGLERVLQRIRAKYPNLLMQACASGGGRVNFGLSPYFDEYWTSDNTDALQRIFIQWSYSHFYPSVAMGAHVSAQPNHQTHRSTPLKFRFDVAMAGRLGMEMQPSDMTEEERIFSKQAIATYKAIRPIIQQGDLYRLLSPLDQDGFASLMYVNDTKQDAVFFLYKTHHFVKQRQPLFRMAGLNPDQLYRLTELNVAGKPIAVNGQCFSGAFLMEHGLHIPVDREYASCVIRLTAAGE